MRTLRPVAESILEASALAAVVLVPLCLDKSTAQVFEPPKASLLQAIAMVALLAWAITRLWPAAAAAPAPPGQLAQRVRVPTIIATLCVLGSSLLSTALSISPAESFWGHLNRGHGTLTLLAELTLFAVVLSTTGSAAQRRRLVTALILPSIPLALYSVGQRLGFEALPLSGRVTEAARTQSLFGQPVFSAAYFDMVLPFTVLRGWECFRDREGSRARRTLFTGLCAAIALLQLAGLLLSESRGATLALLAAACVALLIVAARRGWRRVVLASWALCAMAALAIALGLPERLASVATSAESARIAQRAAAAFAVERGGDFRRPAWAIAERALRRHEAFEFADGHLDRLAAVRAIVGYGPETQYAFSPLSYELEPTIVGTYGLVDRFHNQLWDDLLTAGPLGLLCWLALQTIVVGLALRTLGLLQAPGSTRGFWISYLAGALLGALGWIAVHGVAFGLLGLQLGAVLGLAAFVSLGAWRSRSAAAAGGHDQPEDDSDAAARAGQSLAGLTAIVAHLLETSFSFKLVTTGMLFWIVCALLLVCRDARFRNETSAAEALPESRHAIADAVLLYWVLTALGFAFIGANSLSPNVSTLLWDALSLLNQPAGSRAPLVALTVVTAGLGGALVLLQSRSTLAARSFSQLRITFGIACGLAFVGWCWFASILAQLAGPTAAQAPVLTNLAVRAELLTAFYVSCGGGVLLWAWARARPVVRAKQRAATAKLWPRVFASLACIALTASAVEWLALRPQRADIAFAIAKQLDVAGRFEQAEQAHAQAVAICPDLGVYQAYLGKAYLSRAEADAAQAPRWQEAAEQALRAAITRNPIATENTLNLAHALAQRATSAPAEARTALLPEVVSLHERALRLHPYSPAAWRFWARAQLTLLNDPTAALASVRRALVSEDRNATNHALLGACEVAVARSLPAAARREAMLTAAGAYQRAGVLAHNRASYWVNAGVLYSELGLPEQSATALRAALAMIEPDAPQQRPLRERLQQVEAQLAVVDKADSAR